jgi:hypothetical protein
VGQVGRGTLWVLPIGNGLAIGLPLERNVRFITGSIFTSETNRPLVHHSGKSRRLILLFRSLAVAAGVALIVSVSPCQQASSDGAQATDNNAVTHSDKHILGIIPNFRTSPTLDHYAPISPSEKFKIARQDTFDRGTFLLAAAFAGQSQLSNDNRAFGQGVKGYAQYFGASYADFAIGNFMTEGIYPTILHQDPRYFRRGKGGGWSRLGYSMSQIFWTHQDSGRTNFNFSEVMGNATAVAISNIYYRNHRDASDAVSSLGVQLGVDMTANILKEFWPDFDHKFRRKHSDDSDTANHK